MARRCTCSKIIGLLHEDPRLRTLPLAAQALWLHLAHAMLRPGFEGALPFRDPRRVSLLVSAEVSEVGPLLGLLIAEGLLAEEGESLVAPLLREAEARVLAARRNGAKGGRPRRDETPEQAAARRRQGELLMPIAAPRKPTETSAAGFPGSSSSLSKTESNSVSREETWQQLGAELVTIAGLDASRVERRPVREWLEAGASPELIRHVVRQVSSWAGFKAEKISTLGYFGKAIMRELEAGSPGASLPPIGEAATDFELEVQKWKESGYQGPAPQRKARAA
ncbi:hypothetical protein KTR66_19425 [Roseococcus sp. SDR]|uniref:hypothetical protein n=1 Tax=Roseococcus sp. SDR TaxID=2835532 RepID=UPI001BCEE514|nr:hypothetical protein [Roseococcus sp. SDR]MBS7792179.1 hypothetical protein [Roseococcus sp. SDR]MBV1847493.1 hypothetical protein [Roseococcus sp. SDR]